METQAEVPAEAPPELDQPEEDTPELDQPEEDHPEDEPPELDPPEELPDARTQDEPERTYQELHAIEQAGYAVRVQFEGAEFGHPNE